MVRVVGIDHLVIRVGDYETSKAFYDKLLKFLGFKVLDEYADMIGWTNGKTRFWIGPTDAQGRKRGYRIGDIGFHHYAFELAAAPTSMPPGIPEKGRTTADPAASITTTISLCSFDPTAEARGDG
jgi:catechol 2,3-dioxygenase-like lactoylglutathione lyase family enzyme